MTRDTRPERFEASSYDEEAASIQFFTEDKERANVAVCALPESESSNYIGCFIPQEFITGNTNVSICPL